MKYEIQTTDVFDHWLGKIRDRQAIAEITMRLDRLITTGNFGDHKGVGEGVSELRMMRTGYRVYYAQDGDTLVILLGGSAKKDGKRAQSRDIADAQDLWATIKGEQ